MTARVRELLLAAFGCVLATVVGQWDTVRTLRTSVAGDFGDPLYFAWQLAWVSHSVRSDPTSVFGPMWTTNAFQRAPNSLAYTDVVLGYIPIGLLTGEGQRAALAQLNLALLVATATAAFSGYVLVRVLGSGVPGAMLAAAALGFAPWRDTHVIHINVLSTGGMFLALAVLLYGHGWSLRDGWRPERMSWRWILVGWAVASYQMLFGFALGIWFAYTLAITGAVLLMGWLVRGRKRASIPRSIVAAETIGLVFYLGSVGLLLLPHLWVLAGAPESERSVAMLDLFSPPWYGLLTAGKWNSYWAGRQLDWQQQIGERWPPEMFMSPGLVVIGLAVAGLFVSSWPLRRRLVVGAITLALAIAATGTRGPAGGRYSYLPLYNYLPGWDQLRTPGRLVIWVGIGLAVLGAGFVTEVARQLRRRRWSPAVAGATAALLLLPAGAAYAEGWDDVPRWSVPLAPIDLAALDQPILLLPTGLVVDYHMMFWSTQGWPVIVNGDSSFDSVQQREMRDEAASFPDVASVAALRARGVARVVVIRSRTGPQAWPDAADRSVEGLGIGRLDTGDAVVFDLSPTAVANPSP